MRLRCLIIKNTNYNSKITKYHLYFVILYRKFNNVVAMIEEALNSSVGKEELKKKDIIIWFDSNTSDYADMLKSILSICEPSDAADFNKKVHINRYDLVVNRDNKASISENIYEIFIGQPDKMGWCPEIRSYHGLHYCREGKTAHIYVEGTQTGRKELAESRKFSRVISSVFEECKLDRNASATINHASTSPKNNMLKGKIDDADNEKYVDLPEIFKNAGSKVGSAFKKVFRSIGFARQKNILDLKYQILIKDFYLNYMPELIGEKGAK